MNRQKGDFCVVCESKTKYKCITCLIRCCNRCSIYEENEEVERWHIGMCAGYCNGCDMLKSNGIDDPKTGALQEESDKTISRRDVRESQLSEEIRLILDIFVNVNMRIHCNNSKCLFESVIRMCLPYYLPPTKKELHICSLASQCFVYLVPLKIDTLGNKARETRMTRLGEPLTKINETSQPGIKLD